MADWKKIIVSGSNAHLNDISASGTITGSIVTSPGLDPLLNFNGDRPVTNIFLGEGIYLNNYGTTGNLTNFIESVFFTNTPPELDASQSFTIKEWTTGTSTIGRVQFIDPELGGAIGQVITMSIESNPFFDISDTVGSKGDVFLKSGVIVSKSINIHPSESNGEFIKTYPLNVTATDDTGASDTEKIYIRVIPNNPPVLRTYSPTNTAGPKGNPISTNNPTNEVNEYGDIKTIYIYTSSNRAEETPASNGFSGYSIRYNDSDGDDVFIQGDFNTQRDSNGNQYVNFSNQSNVPGEQSFRKYFLFQQVTASFDFESSSFFDFTITASDEHYPHLDTSSVVYLKYHLEIDDNLPPVISDQFFTVVEDIADESVINTISVSDDHESVAGGGIIFLTGPSNFKLLAATKDLQLNFQDNFLQPYNITSSLSNIGEGDFFNPTRDPFRIDSAGNIIKKASSFLNADIAKYYYYSASVTDIFNENQSSSAAIMRIQVFDDTLPEVTLTHATNNYIIESAETSNIVIQETHGDSTQGNTPTLEDSNSETVNWVVNTVPPNLIKGKTANGVNSGTVIPTLLTSSQLQFVPVTNISESVYTFDAGNTIKVEVTASKTSFPSSQVFNDFTLNIAKNHSPEIIVNNNTNPNSLITDFNLASEGAILYELTFSDIENDSINYNSFNLTGPQSNTLTQLSSSTVGTQGSSISIKCRNHLSQSTTYNFTASIKDDQGFRESSISRSFTIGAKSTGTFQQTAGTYYLIESAVSGAKVTTTSSGIFANNQHISFSVDYGSVGGNPTVQSFTASMQTPQYNESYPGLKDMFSISSGSIGEEGGLLTIKQNISKSNFNQDALLNLPVTIRVSYQDQYGNIGESGDITINPVNNLSPIIFNEVNYTSKWTNVLAVNNEILKQYDIIDPEGDVIETNSAFTSSNTTNGLIVENTANRLNIKANQSLTAGAYHFTASVIDIHNFRSSSVSGTINIAVETAGTLFTNQLSTHDGNVGLKPEFFIEEDGRSGDIIHQIKGEADAGGNNPVGKGLQASMSVNYGSTGLSIGGYAINTGTQTDIDESNGLLSLGADVSGSFTPSEIAAGTAIISASIAFTDNNTPVANTNTDYIYIQVFQNASLGTLTANTASNSDVHLGKPLFYIEECGTNTNAIHTQTGKTSGVGNGSQADLGGLYKNQDGETIGLLPTNFRTSSNSTPHIKINASTGKINLGQNISGSDNNGGFSPSQIAAGNAIFPVQVAFNDSTSNNITIHDTIYVKIFQNASLGTLTANNVDTHNGRPLFYIQEFALDGDHIHTETRIVGGNFNGDQAQLTGSFGTTGLTGNNFTITSTTDGIDVDVNSTTGKLVIGENISGSVTPNQYIGVSASFQDNLGNVTLQGDFYIQVFDNASRGTLNGNSTSTVGGSEQYFVQEAGKKGDIISISTGFTDGVEDGAQGNLDAVYLNPGGAPFFASDIGLNPLNFRTSSHSTPKVTVSSTGLLTLGEDISGSVNVDDIITVPISFTDNGPSGGSGSIHDTIKVKVFANDGPNYYTVDSSGNTQNLPIAANTVIRTFRITDDEHDFPYTASLGGTNADKFYIDSGSSAANNEGTTYSVKALNNITNEASNQNLVYKIIVHDNVGKSNGATAPDIQTNFSLAPNQVFIYKWKFGVNGSNQNFIQEYLGGSYLGSHPFNGLDDHLDPDSLTNVLSGSALALFQSGGIGENTLQPSHTYVNPGGNSLAASQLLELKAQGSLTQLKGTTGIQSFGNISVDNDSSVVLIIFPSSSTLDHKPKKLMNSYNYTSQGHPDTVKRYKLIETVDSSHVPAKVIYFNTKEEHLGFNTWGMIHTTLSGLTAEFEYKLINPINSSGLS